MYGRCRYKALLLQRQKLPIWSAREKLLQAVRESPTLVVVGETGSGKTTQIPQLLYSSGIAGSGMVACTQPRRVAAVTVARRVAEEMNVKLGDLVRAHSTLLIHSQLPGRKLRRRRFSQHRAAGVAGSCTCSHISHACMCMR